MFPNRCSVKEEKRDCLNPPEFVISVKQNNDEFMVGLTCSKHKQVISSKIEVLQEQKKLPQGEIIFQSVKPVGTDCIKGDSDDLIQL